MRMLLVGPIFFLLTWVTKKEKYNDAAEMGALWGYFSGLIDVSFSSKIATSDSQVKADGVEIVRPQCEHMTKLFSMITCSSLDHLWGGPSPSLLSALPTRLKHGTQFFWGFTGFSWRPVERRLPAGRGGAQTLIF